MVYKHTSTDLIARTIPVGIHSASTSIRPLKEAALLEVVFVLLTVLAHGPIDVPAPERQSHLQSPVSIKMSSKVDGHVQFR